jgi:hypothetical protein
MWKERDNREIWISFSAKEYKIDFVELFLGFFHCLGYGRWSNAQLAGC